MPAYTWALRNTGGVMIRTSVILLATLWLSACGLAETATTGATIAASEVEQASQAQQTEKKIQDQIQAAQQQDADRRRAADSNDAN